LTRPISICILFALRRESAPFCRRLRQQETLPDAPCAARLFDGRGKTLLVLETGVGAERTAGAIAWALDHFAPRLVVAAGFAGALSRTLRLAEVFVASEVIESDEVAWRVAVPAELGDLVCGRLYTSPCILTTTAAKKALRQATGALAVDMESGPIAEACVARRVACAAVRAVSDTSDEGLSPELVRLLDGGGVSLRRVFGALVRRPRLIGELWRLHRATRRAARNLAEALWHLVD
jgi:adenosylhomocysteine nucleosidase